MTLEAQQSPQQKFPERLEIKAPALEKMGVKVYSMEGWQLFSYLLDHFAELQTSGTRWFAVCQNGISRSREMNTFFAECQLPMAQPTSTAKEGLGAKFFNFFFQLSEGKRSEQGLAVPSGFSEDIAHLVIFVGENEFNTDRYQELVAGALQELQKTDARNFAGMEIYFVAANENLVHRIAMFAQEQLYDGSATPDIAEKIRQRFNDDYGR